MDNAQLNASLDVDLLTINGNAVDNGAGVPSGTAASVLAHTPAPSGLSSLSAAPVVGADLPTALDGTGHTMVLADASNDPASFQNGSEKGTALPASQVQSAFRHPAGEIMDASWWLPAQAKEQAAATDVVFTAFE